MTTWVVLLRAVNLGATNKVPMAELRELLSEQGYGDVRTLLQSGNVVLSTDDGTATAQLEADLSALLSARFGFTVAVLARSGAEWTAVVESNPFADSDAGPKELHATFLSQDPSTAKLDALDPAEHAPDELSFGDRVMYLRLPNGVSGSMLPAAEKLLGVTTTTRTWNTVTKLLAVVDQLEQPPQQ